MNIELTEKGILFSLAIDNSTPYQIGEVFFPLIGGVQGLGKTGLELKSAHFVRPAGVDSAATADIFHVFTNVLARRSGTRAVLFVSEGERNVDGIVHGEDESVGLMGVQQSVEPRRAAVGTDSGNAATVREDGTVRPDELKGQPVGVSVCFVDFPQFAGP